MVAVIATMCVTGEAYAQPAGSIAPQTSGPTLEAARVAAHVTAAYDLGPPTAALVARPFQRSEVLMIVGGAVFLAGAIIGDDAGTIIMIGGAVMGLYGLYLYLQ